MYSKTLGHHCWWLNKDGDALANFDNESSVDAIIIQEIDLRKSREFNCGLANENELLKRKIKSLNDHITEMESNWGRSSI